MEKLLKDFNLKSTKNREIVIDIITNSILPQSAEDIYKITTSQKHNINLSTVYRTLNTLSDKGILIKQVRQDSRAYFQLNRHEHKHILICNSCHKEQPIDNCPFEGINKKIAKDTGFIITSHNIEIYGICPNCAKK